LDGSLCRLAAEPRDIDSEFCPVVTLGDDSPTVTRYPWTHLQGDLEE